MDKKKIKNVLKNTYTNTIDYLDKQGTKFEQASVFTPKKNGGYQLNPRIKSTINEVKESLFTFKANDPSNKQKRVSPFNKDFIKNLTEENNRK